MTDDPCQANPICPSVIPIIGEVTNPSPWLHLIGMVDVVIDAVGGTADICALFASLLVSISAAVVVACGVSKILEWCRESLVGLGSFPDVCSQTSTTS
jgi:hypothetical protein